MSKNGVVERQKEQKQSSIESRQSDCALASLSSLNLQPQPKKNSKPNSSMSKVPEYWGRDSPYHGGTEFLGTPSDHLEVRMMKEKRLIISFHLFFSTNMLLPLSHLRLLSFFLPPTQTANNSSPPSDPSPRTSSRSTVSRSTTACPSML